MHTLEFLGISPQHRNLTLCTRSKCQRHQLMLPHLDTGLGMSLWTCWRCRSQPAWDDVGGDPAGHRSDRLHWPPFRPAHGIFGPDPGCKFSQSVAAWNVFGRWSLCTWRWNFTQRGCCNIFLDMSESFWGNPKAISYWSFWNTIYFNHTGTKWRVMSRAFILMAVYEG